MRSSLTNAAITNVGVAGFSGSYVYNKTGSMVSETIDGQRAILYAVGKNGKDDGGYKDEKGSTKTRRDDIIYWQRNQAE